MMIFNGINVFPEEIEAVVCAHPQVEDAVAFCVASRVHHEIPCAAVRELALRHLRDGARADEAGS